MMLMSTMLQQASAACPGAYTIGAGPGAGGTIPDCDAECGACRCAHNNDFANHVCGTTCGDYCGTTCAGFSCTYTCTVSGTCNQKTDGTTGGAVTDSECGDDFFATAGSTTACAAAPCNMATAADKIACCTAVATCNQKTDGTTGGAVTDSECEAGFFATAGSTTACAAAPCNMATAADKTACCTPSIVPPPPVPAPAPITWPPPPPPPSQQEPTIPSEQQGDQESTPVTTPPLPPTTKPPTPTTDEQQQEEGQQEEDLVPLVTVVPQILAAASIPLGATTMVVTFTPTFRPEAISPGYVATLTDVNGNTATLVVKSVSADGTIEFETAVKCKQGVECDFLSDTTTIDFSEGPETTTLFQKSAGVVQQVDKTGAPEAGGGHEHDHDHDGDGVQDHAGKNGGTQQAKSAKSTGKGGGEGAKKGTKGKENGVASGERAEKGTKGKGNRVASAMFATEHASVGKQRALTTAVFAAAAVVCIAVAAIIVRKVRGKFSEDEYENLEKEFVEAAEGPLLLSPRRCSKMYKHSAKHSTAGN